VDRDLLHHVKHLRRLDTLSSPRRIFEHGLDQPLRLRNTLRKHGLGNPLVNHPSNNPPLPRPSIPISRQNIMPKPRNKQIRNGMLLEIPRTPQNLKRNLRIARPELRLAHSNVHVRFPALQVLLERSRPLVELETVD